MLVDIIDKLVDRLIQLITYKQGLRHKLLEEHVDPVFAAFEAVHEHYLSSFAGYRNIIKTTTEPLNVSHPIIDLIRSDNLFTEHQRGKILQLGSAVNDPEVGELIRNIHDYLVDVRVAGDPVAGYRRGRFTNPQLWRRTLLGELEAIFEERWQIILDRSASGPPLFGPDLENALKDARQQAGIKEDDANKLEKIKAYFAVRALDEVVADMQDAYADVAAEYSRLRKTLTK